MLRFVGAPMLGNKTQKARSILGHIQSQRARGEAELAKANFKIQVYRAAAAGEAVPEEAFERFGVPRSSIRLKEIKAELPAFLSPENATAAPQFNETATNLIKGAIDQIFDACHDLENSLENHPDDRGNRPTDCSKVCDHTRHE